MGSELFVFINRKLKFVQDKLRRLIISLFFFVLAQCDLAKMVSAQSDSENQNRASSPTIVDFEKVDLIIVCL